MTAPIAPEQKMTVGAVLYWATCLTVASGIARLVGVTCQPPSSFILQFVEFSIGGAQCFVAFGAIASARWMRAAFLVDLLALSFWIIAHTLGIWLGDLWKPELLSVPDFYLPFMEGLAALFFGCLLARKRVAPGIAWRLLWQLAPWVCLAGALVWAATHVRIAQVILAIFVLDANLPRPLIDIFFPALVLAMLLPVARIWSPRLSALLSNPLRFVMTLIPALFIVSMLGWSAAKSAATSGWFTRHTPITATPGTSTFAYCWPGGSPLAMDITRSLDSRRVAPIAIYIHGGETLLGSRELRDGTLDGEHFIKLRDKLVSRGFAVGSIDYRLAPFHHVPEQVQDAKCAVRFLRAHARDLGIDPTRVGVYGPSQGGYLSAMLGVAQPSAGFDVGQYLDESSGVQAVVDMWGPMDLNDFSGSPPWVAALTGSKGLRSDDPRLRAGSPMELVAAGDSPFLIIHGTDDWFIAPHHSKDMAARLTAAQVPVRLMWINHGGHGLDAAANGQIETPSADAMVEEIANFLVDALENPHEPRPGSVDTHKSS